MESVIAGLIVIILALSSANMIAASYLSSQETIAAAWQLMEARTGERARTALTTIGSGVTGSGATVEITLRNSGTTKLADFQRWDLMVQYYTESDSYQVKRLDYTSAGSPGNDQWSVVGIYVEASSSTPEIYDPKIFNSGEEIVIRAKVSPPVGPDTTNLITLVTPNGISISSSFVR